MVRGEDKGSKGKAVQAYMLMIWIIYCITFISLYYDSEILRSHHVEQRGSAFGTMQDATATGSRYSS